jgi:hypothetical protein
LVIKISISWGRHSPLKGEPKAAVHGLCQVLGWMVSKDLGLTAAGGQSPTASAMLSSELGMSQPQPVFFFNLELNLEPILNLWFIGVVSKIAFGVFISNVESNNEFLKL